MDYELLEEIKEKLDDVLYRDGELSTRDIKQIANLIEDLMEDAE